VRSAAQPADVRVVRRQDLARRLARGGVVRDDADDIVRAQRVNLLLQKRCKVLRVFGNASGVLRSDEDGAMWSVDDNVDERPPVHITPAIASERDSDLNRTVNRWSLPPGGRAVQTMKGGSQQQPATHCLHSVYSTWESSKQKGVTLKPASINGFTLLFTRS
jgi:hypothetical protein